MNRRLFTKASIATLAVVGSTASNPSRAEGVCVDQLQKILGDRPDSRIVVLVGNVPESDERISRYFNGIGVDLSPPRSTHDSRRWSTRSKFYRPGNSGGYILIQWRPDHVGIAIWDPGVDVPECGRISQRKI